jgi:membrane associated rhomboid family serine protease
MIPITTDAPIYHYPIATVTTMVLNVIMFLAFCRDPGTVLVDGSGNQYTVREVEDHVRKIETEQEQLDFLRSLTPADAEGTVYRSLSVEFGKIRPWQWVTNNYMHAGWMHLIGNLIFLWAFGIIVEGKVGWFWFSVIYLGIGALYGLVLQVGALAFGLDEGMALGASAAIFGLLALCVAWAPANEFDVVWILGFRVFVVETRIVTFGAIFLFKEMLFWGLQGFQMSSQLLHVLGFAVAMPVGLYLVKFGHVDCEGWDIFSYMTGTTGRESQIQINYEQARNKRAGNADGNAGSRRSVQPESQVSAAELQLQVEEAIDKGSIDLAVKLQHKLNDIHLGMNWRAKDLYRVISGLLKANRTVEALPLIHHYVQNFEENRFAMEVAMIKIWLQQQRPRKVLKYIDGMNLAFYTSDQAARVQPLADKAHRLIAAGVVEHESNDAF